MIDKIRNRINNLRIEKNNLLDLYDHSAYEEEYITKRICYIIERIHELQDLLDDVTVDDVTVDVTVLGNQNEN